MISLADNEFNFFLLCSNQHNNISNCYTSKMWTFCLRSRAKTDKQKSLKQFKKVFREPRKNPKLTNIKNTSLGLTTNLFEFH